MQRVTFVGASLAFAAIFNSAGAVRIQTQAADWSDFLNMGTDVVGGLVGGDVGR